MASEIITTQVTALSGGTVTTAASNIILKDPTTNHQIKIVTTGAGSPAVRGGSFSGVGQTLTITTDSTTTPGGVIIGTGNALSGAGADVTIQPGSGTPDGSSHINGYNVTINPETSTPAAGQVLTSTDNLGTVSWALAPYSAAVAANWNGSAPTTIAAALDRIAAKIGPIA